MKAILSALALASVSLSAHAALAEAVIGNVQARLFDTDPRDGITPSALLTNAVGGGVFLDVSRGGTGVTPLPIVGTGFGFRAEAFAPGSFAEQVSTMTRNATLDDRAWYVVSPHTRFVVTGDARVQATAGSSALAGVFLLDDGVHRVPAPNGFLSTGGGSKSGHVLASFTTGDTPAAVMYGWQAEVAARAVTPVPEPSTCALLLVGLSVLPFFRPRRKR